MKKSILIFGATLAGVLTGSIQAWQLRAQPRLPAVLSQRQEPARTDFVSYTSRAQAMTFAAGDGPQGRKASAYVVDLGLPDSDSAWSCDRRGQTLVLEREFDLPFERFDQAHFLRLGAVKGAVTAYVNDRYVGFSQGDDSSPVEFELTGLLTPDAPNRVRIEVAGQTTVSLLEAGREPGITRGIELRVQPKIRLRDYTVRTTLDPSYTNGFLEVAMLLKSQLLNGHPVTVYYDLYDPRGKLVSRAEREVTVGLKAEDTVRFTASVPRVRKWSDGEPSLYTVLFRVQREGRFTEYVARRVGFREVKVDGTQLLINGQAVQIRGVHVADIPLDSLNSLKKLGYNALRTTRRMPEAFYARCDSLGFYVCDAANIPANFSEKAKSRGGVLSNNPDWLPLFLVRANNLYEGGKNHPCVVMWDMGWGANGYNMYRTYLFLKAKDDTRPVVFSGAWMEWNTDIFMPADYVIEFSRYSEAGYNAIRNTPPMDYRLAGRPYIPVQSEIKSGDSWPIRGAQGGFLTSPGYYHSGLNHLSGSTISTEPTE